MHKKNLAAQRSPDSLAGFKGGALCGREGREGKGQWGRERRDYPDLSRR